MTLPKSGAPTILEIVADSGGMTYPAVDAWRRDLMNSGAAPEIDATILEQGAELQDRICRVAVRPFVGRGFDPDAPHRASGRS